MNMETIMTKVGDVPAHLLSITNGVDEDERATVSWTEYRFTADPNQEVVRRDVHVALKQGLDMLPSQANL